VPLAEVSSTLHGCILLRVEAVGALGAVSLHCPAPVRPRLDRPCHPLSHARFCPPRSRVQTADAGLRRYDRPCVCAAGREPVGLHGSDRFPSAPDRAGVAPSATQGAYRRSRRAEKARVRGPSPVASIVPATRGWACWRSRPARCRH
jgi:hypothetical protein